MLDNSTQRFLEEERRAIIELLLEELKDRILSLPEEDRRTLCSQIFGDLLTKEFAIPRYLRIAWNYHI